MEQTKLKPFDLQAALAGKPVVTRDGRPVKIAGYNEDAANENIKILGWLPNGYNCWFDDGTCYKSTDYDLDLFMAPEKREVWVCLYRSKYGIEFTYKGDSKENAELVPNLHNYIIITTVKIWEEEI